MPLEKQVFSVIMIIILFFIVKEILFPFWKNRNLRKQIKEMFDQGLDAEQIKNRLISKDLARINNIEINTWKINNKVVKQGDRISFQTLEDGLLAGEFLGVKESKAKGYTYHWYMKRKIHNSKEGEIIAIPIEIIIQDTFMVYG